MTDLVARVLLKADGSGLVGQVRQAVASMLGLGAEAKATGAALAGVAAPANQAAAATAAVGAAARETAGAVENVAAGMRPAAAAAEAMGKAIAGAGSKATALAAAEARLAAATSGLAVAQDRAAAAADADAAAQNRAAAAVTRGLAQVASAQLAVERAQAKNTGSANDNEKALNRQAFGARNLGQQFGDLGLSIAGGISPARAFGQQAGQMGFALSEMGGAAGKVGAFLTGPWGIALTIGLAIAAPFIEKLFEGSKAADELKDKLDAAATAADSFGNAQSLLGKLIDLNTGKFKSQNDVLRETIRLQATAGLAAARKEEKTAAEAVTGLGRATTKETFLDALTVGGGSQYGDLSGGGRLQDQQRARGAGLAPLRDIASQFAAGKLPITAARIEVDKLAASGKLAGRDVNDIVLAFAKLGTARNDQKAFKETIDAIDGKGVAADLKPYQAPKKPKKPKDTSKAEAALQEFGEDAADRIGGLTDQFRDAPAQVEKVKRALVQLADIEDDIRRKKPLNLAVLLADVGRARTEIEAGLNKPFDDFVRQQQDALRIQALETAGRADEAAALKIVLGLEREIGPLSEARKDEVLATVQAMRAEQREADILHDKQQKYLGALADIRSAVRGVIFDGIDGLKSLPSRLVQSFATLKGEQLFDKLFDGAFRDLQDQVNGTSIVKDASARMATAVDTTVDPLKRLAVAAAAAAGAVAGKTAAGATVLDASGRAIGSFPAPAAPGGDGDEVVVTGRRRSDPRAFFSDALGKLAKGVGISDDAATKIGKFGGRAIEGAATGAFANSLFAPLAKGLGLKSSQTGAQLGGAIGGATGIPGASEVGAILGSIAGGLLKKTKQGAVTLTSATGDVDATGNNAAARKAAAGLGGSVQSGLASIADQLGGVLGAFSVTLGQRGGDYRVNTSGTSLKTKKGAVNFGDDADAAAAYALQQAIKQGAVKGLSAAVAQAIQSSDDLDKALREALAVQNLEATLGGIAGELGATFRASEKEAAERLRLARTYGLDLVKTEELNAKKRADVFDQVLESRIGSLKSLAADLAYGDLSKGSPADKRATLSDEAAKALKEAEAGIDGAADRYADLARQLLANDKDAYGTAGPVYAADRAAVDANVARIIQMETERVKSAQDEAAKLSAGVDATNTALDENNDQNAQMIAKLDGLIGAVAALSGGGSTASAYSTARSVQLV